MESPLRITVYDRDGVRTAWCEDFIEHSVKPRHLALGSASLVLPTDYRNLPALAADGARAVVELSRPGDPDEVVLSGKIRNFEAESGKLGVTTFDIEDDFRLFSNLLGYPAPATWQPDANGVVTQASKSDDRSGPAETVVKAYLQANLARWAGRTLPYVVVPTQGRGSALTVTGVRMTPLGEKLLPLLEKSGVGFTVRQIDGSLVVDAYATQLFPIDLSEEAGTVETWKIRKAAYVATAAAIGGPNAGTSREFRYARDAAREARVRDVVETFVDASSETVAAKILGKGTEQLAQSDDKWGVELSLSETSVFRYGGVGGVHVGDAVRVQFPVGLPAIQAPIGEADLSFNLDAGYRATFTVGSADADADDVTADLLDQVITALHEIRAQ